MRKGKITIKGGLIKWLFFSFLFLLLSYFVYTLFIFLNIEVEDPLYENVSTHRILSNTKDDLEKTVFILEREKDEKRKISDVYVFLHNSKKENSFLIYIPGSVYFNRLEENFGNSISVSSLRYAGDFLQEGRGIEYALWQLNEILGFEVDSYIWITTEAYELIEDIYGDMNQIKEKYKAEYVQESDSTLSDSFFKLHTLSSSYSVLKTAINIQKIKDLDGYIYSNYSFFRVLREINKVENIIKSTETYAVDIGSLKYSIQELSEQGGQIKIINVSEYDKTLRNYLFKMIDRNVEEERVRIEVYNASGVGGKAAIYARKILNSGCDVVRFGNAPNSIEKTSVYVSDRDAFTNSLNVVSEILSNRFEDSKERPSFMTTGDIVILLGEDISQIEIF